MALKPILPDRDRSRVPETSQYTLQYLYLDIRQGQVQSTWDKPIYSTYIKTLDRDSPEYLRQANICTYWKGQGPEYLRQANIQYLYLDIRQGQVQSTWDKPIYVHIERDRLLLGMKWRYL